MAKKATKKRAATKKAGARRSAPKQAATKKRAAVKKKAAPKKKAAAKKPAPKRGVMKKAAAPKKAAMKKMAAKKKVAPKKAAPKKKAATRKVALRKPAPRPMTPVSTRNWPSAMPKAEVDVKLGDERAEQPESERSPEVKSFQRQGGAPVIPHPARASAEGATHDRPGSQPERMKHLYPNGNRPNAGSARSTQAKGKRRDNMTQGGE